MTMTFLRQYIAPLMILLVFAFALLAVSIRIFLPNDLAAPAPIEEINAASVQTPAPDAVVELSIPNQSTSKTIDEF
ncbi:MAG: hypothetical protein F6K58_01195 [Symploca sp. SIO2E9]|nr:hypothetical protein [Symploca sp. SIO2E9]